MKQIPYLKDLRKECQLHILFAFSRHFHQKDSLLLKQGTITDDLLVNIRACMEC